MAEESQKLPDTPKVQKKAKAEKLSQDRKDRRELGKNIVSAMSGFIDVFRDNQKDIAKITKANLKETQQSLLEVFSQPMEDRDLIANIEDFKAYLEDSGESVEEFCKKCYEIGIDGLIIPDLPIDIYLSKYKLIFEKNQLQNIFLITPQTSKKRIEYIDKNSDGFLYVVSSSSITGSTNKFNENSLNYFRRLEKMRLSTPKIIGFGISNKGLNYLRPLIQGETLISYKDGIPIVAKLKNILVKKVT